MAAQTILHYRILSKIGAGGMGEVYLAHDTRLERRVAIKLLAEEFTGDEGRLRRFVQEAKTASALNHPNIITIHEIGQAAREPKRQTNEDCAEPPLRGDGCAPLHQKFYKLVSDFDVDHLRRGGHG